MSEKEPSRLRRDNDGHWYIVPIRLMPIFDELVEIEDGWADDRWGQFEAMRIDSPEGVSIMDWRVE